MENRNMLVRFTVEIPNIKIKKKNIVLDTSEHFIYCLLTVSCDRICFIILINHNFFKKRYFTKIKMAPRFLDNMPFFIFGNTLFNSKFNQNVTTHI